MSKKKEVCQRCIDLNEAKEAVTVSEVRIAGSFYHYFMFVRYCPECGRKLNKYSNKTEVKTNEQNR